MKKKLKIGVIFGGKSTEHEVSLQSARNVINLLDKTKYDIVPIGINKKGKWMLQNRANYLLNENNPKLIGLNKSNKEIVLSAENFGALTDISSGQSYEKIDVAFPVLHGPFGEDGSIQGLLKIAGIPFVGASILGSAVGMDKDVMKRLLRDAGIPIAKFIACKKGDLPTFLEVKKILNLPFFIKPANTASSVGVSKVKNSEGFKEAVDLAFKFDTKIIIEEAIKGREIECGVIGNDNPIVSVPGEIIHRHEFYSYEAKYIDEEGATYKIPAKLPKNIIKKVQKLALETFKVLSCEGMGRVDFFLKDNGEVLVNEINTIPGPVMFRRLWEESGIPFTKILDKLIYLAIKRFNKEKKLKTSI